MSYRIPRDDDVAKAIDNCLSRSPRVRSLTVLTDLVETELMCVDESYRIRGERIRKVGVKRKLFDLEISYAHSGRTEPYKKCPVCGNKLESVKNRTLDWKTVELSRDCKVCGYSAKTDACRPARYVITRRNRDGPDREAEEGRGTSERGRGPHGRGAQDVRDGIPFGKRFGHRPQDRIG